MKKRLAFTACTCLLALLFSCKNETPAPPEAAPAVTLSHAEFKKNSGTDCDKPDTLRLNCLTIDLAWPKVETGSDALKKSVGDWANSYIVGILAPASDDSTAIATTVDTAATGFIDMHKEFASEAEGSVMGNWMAEASDTVLLNNGKYLTLSIAGYVYAGGAHGSPTAAVATFDVATGMQLTWDDLVTDKAALKTLAEKKYRQEMADVFKDGFEFDDFFKFELPANFGLVQDGIYFHYLHYEVGPYAIGNAVFVLPFSEIGALAKVKP